MIEKPIKDLQPKTCGWVKWQNPIVMAVQNAKGADEEEYPIVDIGEHYRLWVLHTGIDINEDIKNIVKNTAGIEYLKVLSPYRCILAIGYCFCEETVQYRIQQQIKEYSRARKQMEDDDNS